MIDLDAAAPCLSIGNLAAEWERYSEIMARPHARRMPDFLIIGPPKTGTTWLYANLLPEPDVTLPVQKESRYFTHNWRLFDLDRYAQLIDATGTGQLGEASPDYFGLPEIALAALSRLRPDLKVVVLLRNPAERLWSHLKHQWRYRESHFAGWQGGAPAKSDWLAAARHPEATIYADYAGALARWRRYFPESQIFIGFMSEIEMDPAGLIARIKEFLGLDGPVAADPAALYDRVNIGSNEKPSFEIWDGLRRIARPFLMATAEAVPALPATWQIELETPHEPDCEPPILDGLSARLFSVNGQNWISPGAIFDYQALTDQPDWFSVYGDMALLRYRGWLYAVPRPSEPRPITRDDLILARDSEKLIRAETYTDFESMV